MNASLQNPYMMIHPPLLYLGYVSLTIPFAFAMAALASRRVDERWIVASRRWTLFSWTFLGLAILLGAKWAYESIGWGGYYAWDPVENAALMPWLAATAFLHSVMVQEKKNMLRVWNVVLIALTFSLTLFGTFLTRSGAINSIHSFTQSSIGVWFLALIVVVAVGSAALIFSRLSDLRTPTRFESLASREAAFLYNNLLLVAFALTMLWGVAFPLLSEALRGESVTVGPPYYNFFLKVFGLPLLLLMGFGPLLAWRRASLRSLARAVAWPLLFALLVGTMLLFAGAGSSPPGLIAYTFATFVIGAITLEFWRGTRAGKTSTAPPGSAPSHHWWRAIDAATAATSPTPPSSCSRSAWSARPPTEAPLPSGYDPATHERRRLHGDLPWDYVQAGREPRRVARPVRALLRRRAGRRRRRRQEPLQRRAVLLERRWHPHGLASRRGRDADRRSVQPGRLRLLKIAVNPLIGLIWLAGIVFLIGSAWPCGRTHASSDSSLGDHSTRRVSGADDERSRSSSQLRHVGRAPLRGAAVLAGVRRRPRRIRTRFARGADWSSSRNATARWPRSRSSSSITEPARSRIPTTAR